MARFKQHLEQFTAAVCRMPVPVRVRILSMRKANEVRLPELVTVVGPENARTAEDLIDRAQQELMARGFRSGAEAQKLILLCFQEHVFPAIEQNLKNEPPPAPPVVAKVAPDPNAPDASGAAKEVAQGVGGSDT